jgi:amidohydrolase
VDIKDYVISIRRKIHQNPELGFEEFETQKLIIEELEKLGIDYKKISTGLICDIGTGEDSENFIAFRADMDALPVCEETGKEYASKIVGKMHACGHDNHVAILLGVIKKIAEHKNEIKGKIRFIFQPNEEGTDGAKYMVENGVFESIPKAIFGLHVNADLNVGSVGLKYDEMMASVDEFKIILQGTGGHAAIPHKTEDVILAGAQIVSALNTIISRNINPTRPALLSVCTFNSGSAFNILPKNCELTGTIRTFDEQTRSLIKNKINEIVSNFCKANNLTAKIEINDMHGALVNDNFLVDLVKTASETVVGLQNIIFLKQPSMGGEDFSEYLKQTKGCYFYLGVKNESKNAIYGWHNPKFDIDEDALEIGVNIFCEIIKKYFN